MAGNNTAIAPVADEQREWLEWANYHRNLFGWSNPNDAPMLATWVGFFRRGGYSAPELQQATDLIAKQTQKLFKREDHLSALQVHLHAIRQQGILRRPLQSQEDQRGTCIHCGDSGAVSVPLVGDVDGGEWTTRRTCAVWCTCWAGRQFSATRNEKGEAMMGLHEYTHRNPHWRRQIEDGRTLSVEADVLRTEAVEAAGGAKGMFDIMRERLMHRWGMIEGEAPPRPAMSMSKEPHKKSVDLTAARRAFEDKESEEEMAASRQANAANRPEWLREMMKREEENNPKKKGSR